MEDNTSGGSFGSPESFDGKPKASAWRRIASDLGRLRLAVRRRGWRRPALLFFWAALIFGTSCTVVRPNEFFELVARLVGAEQDSMQRFAAFWAVSWFAIVKGWHFTEFFILTLFAASAVKWWRNGTTAWSIAGSMLLCIAFAASDEWHQSFVPDRFGTVQDVVIDSLGVGVAGAVLLLRLGRENARGRAGGSETETMLPSPGDGGG